MNSLQAKIAELEKELARQETIANTGKLVSNGSFGKFGNRWSKLYSPELMIQVTITGQLALLMLIETLELNGISVLSGNTDGIVVKVHESQFETLNLIKEMWEDSTHFNLEQTEYDVLYSKDVNNYVAVKPDGKTKTKGVFAYEGLQKNPYTTVVTDAVVQLLVDGVLIEDTVNQCQDIRRFVSVQTVKGGAIDHHGNYLGKAVRWYYAKYNPGEDFMGDPCLRYVTNMNLVSDSLGAKPLMQLPADYSVPDDIDRSWYINEAKKTLELIGVNG